MKDVRLGSVHVLRYVRPGGRPRMTLSRVRMVREPSRVNHEKCLKVPAAFA